ncbi:DinB family protein [Plantactinospora sp. S1510]|uniref:DinB family protein n=1 Tax=Plantactinospora alkalitolerans TaxID=2789879 RepID=A0ABS0H3K2_9ACTN|nr:DinB family protein [Plantactinospora alkalitolerans]MBF9132899.1 DinB family protein [Plantactinospora alkalitolerans]
MIDPPLAHEELVTTDGERAVWEAFLDCQRRELVEKITGVSDEDARRRLVPSLTTLGGLLKHLSVVERTWFQRRIAQRDPADIAGSVEGGDPSWTLGPDDTVKGLLTEYAQACAESRRVAAGFALDHAVPHARLGLVSLRWIYAHMIEETARHAGHADILREQLEQGRSTD